MRTYYEFFAGGGMARTGLSENWKCVFANDICSKKSAAYASNWQENDLFTGDVFDVTTAQLPGHADLAWGSFPCQDLSLAGNGHGLQGERSGAFWGYWRLIRALNVEGRKPRLVVLENVCGALTSREGKDFEQIARAITQEGYMVGAMVIDAVHFVPQSRPRLFILGVDAALKLPADLCAEQPSPAWHPDALIRAYHRLPMAIKHHWRWLNLPTPKHRLHTLDDVLEHEPTGVKWHSPQQTQALLAMMTDTNRRKVLEAQRLGAIKAGTVYRRTRDNVQRAEVRFDGVAGCLRTPAGGSSRQTILIVDGPNIRSRLISPREAARLMGLPDHYVLPARYNDAYHLLGDGVVVPVVKHIQKHILSPIISANQSLPIPRLGSRLKFSQ
ncbi:MAG: DNA (cytosine-5-)-methyltransferase [Ideonella sp. MAG2]|nr:MAG: DNA (cytosine-5-)-methyltransferase [Ideonella sp. MAG2]